MSHTNVLQKLGCDDLYGLVDPEFLKSFNLNQPGQYGMVCQNVQAHMASLEKLGTSSFFYSKTKGPNWREKGILKPDVKVELAMAYSNGQQIELLGPGENTRFYTDKIPSDDTLALHHVCIFQKGIDDLEKSLNAAGFETAMTGHIGIEGVYTTKFRYLDTREELGFYIELAEYKTFGRHTPPGEGVISGLGKLQSLFRK